MGIGTINELFKEIGDAKDGNMSYKMFLAYMAELLDTQK